METTEDLPLVRQEPRAPLTSLRDEVLAAIPRGKFGCAGCSVELDYPGVCVDCDAQAMARQHEVKVLRFARETIPPRFRWAKLEAPELAKRVNAGLLSGIRALVGTRLPTGLVLLGGAGTGKTTLGCVMLRRVHDSAPWNAPEPTVHRARLAYFVSVPELRQALREHKRGTPAPDLLTLAKRATVLVLDDLDDDVAPEIADLMSDRHNQERPTIVTTWLTRDRAAAVYGDRLVRRAYERVIEAQS